VLTSTPREFEPALIATIHPLKPALAANEPAFILADLHLIDAKRN
jgi:hypothetical protein